MWGFGICAGGFFTLSGCIVVLWQKMGGHMKFKGELDDIKNSLDDIKVALIGDFTKKGLLTKTHEQASLIEEINKRCKEMHKNG